MTLRDQILDAMPKYIHRLVAGGYISCSVEDKGPAPAWTHWDAEARRYEVCFLKDMVANISPEALAVVWQHELNHIALGHFSMPPCGTDNLLAADIAANWYLRERGTEFDEIDAWMDGESVRTEPWLDKLELSHKAYPAPVLHDIIHQMIEEAAGGGKGDPRDGQGPSFCGGIESPEDGVGKAISAIISSATQHAANEAGVEEAAGGKDYGNIGGEHGVTIMRRPLPPWLKKFEAFARSIVEVTLGEARSHKRPVPALEGIGVHVPSQRPQWVYAPATVCLLVDTSGSMLDEIRYVGPVLEYMKRAGIEVRLIAGDIRVTIDEIIKTIPATIPGGGGTDIVPLWERAADYDPLAVVCFSDGYIPKWPKDPKVPCLWVGCNVDVPFGEKA
mgnify:CR=1 FL=1